MSQRLAEYQMRNEREERVAWLEESEATNKHSGPAATRGLSFGFISFVILANRSILTQ